VTRPEGAPLVITEGEKDVEALRDALPGWTVTTSPGGARGWRDVHTRLVLDLTADGSEVILAGDDDDAGAAWQRTILLALHPHRVVKEVGRAVTR
jgi:DNA primase